MTNIINTRNKIQSSQFSIRMQNMFCVLIIGLLNSELTKYLADIVEKHSI